MLPSVTPFAVAAAAAPLAAAALSASAAPFPFMPVPSPLWAPVPVRYGALFCPVPAAPESTLQHQKCIPETSITPADISTFRSMPEDHMHAVPCGAIRVLLTNTPAGDLHVIVNSLQTSSGPPRWQGFWDMSQHHHGMCRHLCLSDAPALSEVMSLDESSPVASDALGERMTRGRRMSSNLGNVCFGAAVA